MTGNRLYVGNLSYQTSEDALRQAFAAHGTVVSVTIIQGKGFGFVEMDSPDSAQKARDALNGTEFDGRAIRVDEARPKRTDDRGGERRERGDRGGRRERGPRW